MIPYFQALFIQRHGMISALMIYGRSAFRPLAGYGLPPPPPGGIL